jgi:hypothetical protein
MKVVRRLMAIVCVPLAAVPVRAQQPVVSLTLDHLAIVLDSATLHDIKASPFMQEDFAAFDSATGATSAGRSLVQLTGKYNWLMLTTPSGAHPVGDVTIALGAETAGAIDAMMRQGAWMRVTSAGGSRGTSPADSMAPAQPDYRRDFMVVARIAGADSTSDRVRFEVMQHAAEGARALSQRDSLPRDDLTAARFLAPYYDRHRLLEYLSGATLAIPVTDIGHIVRMMRRDSVPVFAEGQGAIIRLNGFTLHLIPPWGGAGVKQLQFALTRELLGNPTYRFGPTSQLRFGPGPTAVWDFGNR